MENNNKNKQQNFTRPKACQSAESNCNRKSTTDLQANKPWPRNSRRREQPSSTRNDSQRNSKQYPSVKARPYVDKRPRQRGGGYGGTSIGGGGNSGTHGTYDDGAACASEDVFVESAGLALPEPTATGALAKQMQKQHADYELNSVYAPGSKKQNLNHLLNFHYAPRESDYAVGLNVFGRGGGSGAAGGMQRYNQHGGGAGKRHKYNKEQFLQANFQFVIKSSAKPSLTNSPDTLIDWNLIEQINIQTTEEPQCPICLYPPIAAKLTRCGHAYCWPCILHYLALSDKSWRKCPICYEAIHTADLKSTTIIQQRQVRLGDLITFQLMRRKKGSIYIEKFDANSPQCNRERYPQVSSNDEAKLFSKILIAKGADILDIVEREQRELITDEDPTCPEFVFIQQALDLLKERREKLVNSSMKEDEEEDLVVMEQKKDADAHNLNTTIEQDAVQQEVELAKQETEETEFAASDGSVSSEEQSCDLSKDVPHALNGHSVTSATGDSTKYYYFYQSEDGQNIYLHPLNVKMLQACYGTLDRAPLVINARVLQKEHHSMDEEHRRKFTCLGHLPLTCQFAVVEVDLQPPIVTGGILRLFKEDILFRKKERQRREREEHRREKQINELNDRQMGKLIACTANLNLSSAHEFPTWGFEETLPSVAEAADVSNSTTHTKSAAITAPKRHVSYSTVAVVGDSPTVEEYWPTLASPPSTSMGSNNIYHELSTWGKSANNTVVNTKRTASERSSECESLNESTAPDVDAPTSLLRTELGDVLAMAISQKKQQGSSATARKKNNKKAKKLLPLFSTGINYNGN